MLGLWSYACAYDDPYVAGLTSFLCFAYCFNLMLMLMFKCEPGFTRQRENSHQERVEQHNRITNYNLITNPQFNVSTEALNALFRSLVLRSVPIFQKSVITIYHTAFVWKECDDQLSDCLLHINKWICWEGKEKKKRKSDLIVSRSWNKVGNQYLLWLFLQNLLYIGCSGFQSCQICWFGITENLKWKILLKFSINLIEILIQTKGNTQSILVSISIMWDASFGLNQAKQRNFKFLKYNIVKEKQNKLIKQASRSLCLCSSSLPPHGDSKITTVESHPHAQSLQKMLGHLAFSIRLTPPLPLLNVSFIQRFLQYVPGRSKTRYSAQRWNGGRVSHETRKIFCLPRFWEGSAIFRGVPSNFCKDCRLQEYGCVPFCFIAAV